MYIKISSIILNLYFLYFKPKKLRLLHKIPQHKIQELNQGQRNSAYPVK